MQQIQRDDGMKLLWALLIAVLVMGTGAAFAQEPMPVDGAALAKHKAHGVPPVYPAIARAAQVTGEVVVQITIDTSGKVEETKVISGPPMLQQAAVDCVKQWTYRPFAKNRAPVPAVGRVSLLFSLGDSEVGHGPRTASPPNSQTITVRVTAPDPRSIPDEDIAREYFKAFQECLQALTAHADKDVVSAACKSAADLAAQFPPGQRFIERRSADVYAATALGSAANPTEALVYANRAVDEVKLGHDDASGSSAAYWARGMVEASMGDLTAADQDLTTAEDFERKGVLWAKGVSAGFVKDYQSALAQDLRLHADVLMKLNRPADAQAKLDEAANL